MSEWTGSDWMQMTENCGPGEIYHENICRDGDPHGGNLRDLLQNIADERGESSGDYWRAMVSNQCVGTVDNDHPFTHGYRSDK